MTQTDSQQMSARALTLLDLTNLNDDCTEADIDALCRMAETRFGSVAAICIWPRFIPQAKGLLANKPVKIASVANFPAGGVETLKVVDEAVGLPLQVRLTRRQWVDWIADGSGAAASMRFGPPRHPGAMGTHAPPHHCDRSVWHGW